jgi:hypothetical protein
MRLHHLRRQPRALDPKAVAISGLVAGAAFVAVLEVDLRLTGRNVDDLMILGRPFIEEQDKARVLGGAIHAINSLALASLYAVLERDIPGPPWLKGIIFANVENVILYPITLFEDVHPAIRIGLVEPYFTWPAFWQSVPRDVAFSVVLGVLYDRLRPAGVAGPAAAYRDMAFMGYGGGIVVAPHLLC